jgi:hypothetical protein
LAPHPNSLANLKPPQPGEVRNPTGRNQYTYRTEAEKNLDEWCKDHGREMVRVIADAARAGKPWAAKLILDRVLPAVQKHEVELPLNGAAKIETEPARLQEVSEILSETETLH